MYKRINWSKMHIQNYGRSCVDCGKERCTDGESIAEWKKLYDNINMAYGDGNLIDTKKLNYYEKRKDDYLSYVRNF